MWNGSTFTTAQQTIAGHMDTSGSFTVSVPSNTSITPSQSTWDLQVCPISQGNTGCYVQRGLTITGATQNISSSVIPPPALIDLAHPAYPFALAYTNAEFSTAPMGSVYYDYTQAHYFLCSNVTPTGQAQWYGTCSTWKEFCFVGDGLCAPAPTPGCTLPGINTGVLSEHPAGTCYDSLHWTWDDGTSKQNMLLGDGTNSVGASGQLTFLVGFANAFSGSGSETFAFGDNNLFSGSGSSHWTLGSSNTFTTTQDLFVIGEGNTIDHSNANTILGFNNIIQPSTANTAMNLRHCYTVGESNTLQSHISTTSTLSNCAVIGFSNNITQNNTANGFNISDVFLAGTSNTVTGSTSHNILGVHIMGTSNTVANTLNDTNETEVVGEQNSVDGAESTLQILGFLNVAHNVSSQGGPTVNTTIVGSANAVTNTGASGTPAYQGVFGGSNTLQNCHNCWIVGDSVSSSASNELDMGMSATAEIKVTPGAVTVTPLASGGTQCVQANSAGTLSGTGTGCPGTKAILAAPTVCNLSSDITSIPSTTPTTIIACATTAPSSGCPCRAIVSWSIIGDGSSSTEQLTAKVNDGTSDFGWAAGDFDNQISSGYKGVNRSVTTPNLYSNSATVTFTLTAESDHTFDVRAVSTFLSAPTQVQVTYLSSN